MYIAPSYRMAKQIVYDDLYQMLKERKWLKAVNKSDLAFTLVNGSIIYLRSADNPDSIRGIGLDYVVLDEAADISEDAWKAVIRPTLSDKEGSAMIISTPKGRGWLYDVFNDAKHLPDWNAWQFTTAEGGIVSKEELAQARLDLGEREYLQEYEAKFVDYSGLIYYAFGEHNIKDMDFANNEYTTLNVGADHNIDPGCAVIAFQHSGGLHIFDEIEIYGSDTSEMAREIMRRYPNRRYICYPDASGAQRRTSAIGGITDHIIWKNHGFQLKVGSVNPAVKDRIASVNAVCKADNMRLTISPKCVKVIKCLRSHTYKEGTRQPTKGEHDHFNDALGYMVNNLYPLRVVTKQKYSVTRRA